MSARSKVEHQGSGTGKVANPRVPPRAPVPELHDSIIAHYFLDLHTKSKVRELRPQYSSAGIGLAREPSFEMESSTSNAGFTAMSPAPLPPSTNSDRTTSLFQQLSLNTASETALPPSSPVSSPNKTIGQRTYPSSPNGKQPPRSPLPRSPSSTSFDARSSTPTLHKKASMNSLHGIGGVTPPRISSSRRSSSVQFTNGHAAPVMGKSPLSGLDDYPSTSLPLTAAAIAMTHFKKELDLQGDDLEGPPADTIVILHDSCYGHRFSRPRTSKVSLSTVVERPERIHASILGVSVAYVRLGQRHSEGRYPIRPTKDAANIPAIPFRIRRTTRKLALSSPAVTNVHGVKWMEELKIMCDSAEAKLAMSGKELTRPEMNRSSEGKPAELHSGDLYLCSESLNAMEGALGAVCEGVDAVFKGSATGTGPHRTFIAIRPPGHHCSASLPSGFCWLNNVHVGIAHAALHHGLTHAAIIDFDLHHGDGSQAIAWEHNTRGLNLPKAAPSWKKTSIGYFSLHDINSYPCENGEEEKIKNASLCIDNAHGQSIWNVHLQPWKSEHEFWELYETKYSVLLEKTRAYLNTQTQRLRSLPNQPQPKAAIFLSAGFDASEWESSGMQRHKVNVPTEFYARLTRDVVKIAAEQESSVEGRIISVLEGGYSDRALSSGVLSHISGLAGGDSISVKSEIEQNGLGYEIAQKVGAYNTKIEPPNSSSKTAGEPYDVKWWALPQLELLDALVHPPAPLPEPKKPRETPMPTYFSPTQSFTAKINTTPKLKRSSSNLNGGSPRPVSRPPSPPPPEVPWTIAAHELSKLLIPSDRQTMSCKPEDLSAEASRARRDRQSIIVQPDPVMATVQSAAPPVRMSLRERKAGKTHSTAEEAEEAEKSVSKANRRKTIAGAAVLTTEKTTTNSRPEPNYKQPTKQSTRRLSLMSSAETLGSQMSTGPAPNGHSRAPSIGPTTVPARPESSQSIRPGSSMSSKGQVVLPVVVKKSRVVNPARPEAAKNPRTSRKSPPVNNAKTGPGGEGANEVPSLTRSSKTTAGSKAPKPTSTADVDSITTGMKKITINLTTKAQREAREQAKLAPKAESSSEAETTSQNRGVGLSASPTEALPSSNSNTYPPLHTMSSTSIPSTPQPLPPSRFAHLQDASNVPLPASSPPAPIVPHLDSPAPTSNHPPAFRNNGISNMFVSYQPEGPTPASIPQQEPLKWLPPNTSTPVAMKRSDLPVFTSTTPIPFGANANKVAGPPTLAGERLAEDPMPHVVKQEKSDSSIWEVPETPRR